MSNPHSTTAMQPDATLPRPAEPPPPPRLGTRVLGWTLMTASLGLVSCQSLFVL
jgi:hypothetical protein